MKKKKIICLFCFVLGMVLVYYLGYTIGKKYNNTNAVTREWVYENNPAVYSTEEGKEAYREAMAAAVRGHPTCASAGKEEHK